MSQIVSKAVGIDLGTTNSAVAVMQPTDTDILIHRDANSRSETTPSCVWMDPRTGSIEVGRRALRRFGHNPGPVRSIKRIMGRPETVRLHDQDVSPERVSAWILAEMKRQIEEDVATFATAGREWIVDRAVVTVPAYFDQPSIDATSRAGELAGLEVLELLHEPTAAACYHCWRTGTQNGVFLVYDFGGGTFDVTVLRSTAGTFEVLGISGNNRLGGDDLDALIADSIRERLLRDDWPLELDVAGNPEDRVRQAILTRIAEDVKIGLSQSDVYLLRNAMGLTDTEGATVIVDTEYARGEIDGLLAPTIQRTIPCCFDALEQAEKRANVKLADVDAIVLAGGSTHVPLVREIVRLNLCAIGAGDDAERARRLVADPRAAQAHAKCAAPVYERVDSVVALGAAIRAAASGGLAVYDSGRSVRVSFRGVGVTGARETRMGGNVDALRDGLDLEGGAVRLRIPELEYDDEEPLGEGGSFAFRRMPLQPSADNELSFEVLDARGESVATVGRVVSQDEDGARQTGGSSTGTSVLAKAIKLEDARDRRIVQRPLAEELATLPLTNRFEFVHPGDTELVILPLYQGKRKIQEIHVPVDSSLPAGTPVEMTLNIDDKAFITVTGSIGDVDFSAAVEAPPPRDAPTADEFAKVESAFAEGLGYLPAGRQHVENLKWRQGHDAYDAALQRGESDQAVHEFEQLEALAAAVSGDGGPLRPPKTEFDALVAEVHALNKQVAELGGEQPHDVVEVQRTIESQRTAGERAFEAGEQLAYGDAIEGLQRIREHLYDLGRKAIDDNGRTGPTEEEKARDAVRQVSAMIGEALQLAQAKGRADLEQQLVDLHAPLQSLDARASRDPDGVMRELQSIAQKVQRVRATLADSRRPGGGGGVHVHDTSG